jgi:hypothetical protein
MVGDQACAIDVSDIVIDISPAELPDGTCPPPLTPVTKPSVKTRASCTGGIILNFKGVCQCPNSSLTL